MMLARPSAYQKEQGAAETHVAGLLAQEHDLWAAPWRYQTHARSTRRVFVGSEGLWKLPNSGTPHRIALKPDFLLRTRGQHACVVVQ